MYLECWFWVVEVVSRKPENVLKQLTRSFIKLNKQYLEIDVLLELESEMTWFLWKMGVHIVGRTHTLQEVLNILETKEDFSTLQVFFFSRGAPVRFSGIQMIHALGGFHRQSNPQHRDQAQWPQSQEAQLCSQMNTRPLRENTNTIQPIRFNEDRLESRLKLGRIWALESGLSLTFNSATNCVNLCGLFSVAVYLFIKQANNI